MNNDKPIVHEHPSYAMIKFSRSLSSNATRLFGSSLASHYATISMTVTRARWQHDLHEDHYYGNNEELIEVEMSSAQFAELITSMNIGSGVPCTLRRYQGSIDEPPDIETEVQRVKTNFKDDLSGMVAKMSTYRAEIEKLTAKLPDKARERLRVALDVIVQQLASNVPFIVEQFNEASDRIVTAAKHDIEAFTMHALHTAGLAAIADGHAIPMLAAPRQDGDK